MRPTFARKHLLLLAATALAFLPPPARADGACNPLLTAIRTHDSQLFREVGDTWQLDEEALLLRFANLNDALRFKSEGSLQVYPYDGKFYFFFVEKDRTYFIPSEHPKDAPELTEKLPAFLSSLKPGTHLTERFKRPAGFSIVGYERAFNGLIVPIFSRSNQLTEFRDFSRYSTQETTKPSALMGGEKARIAIEVPLVQMRHLGRVETKNDLSSLLPEELRALLASGITLTSKESLEGIDLLFKTPQTQSPSPYSALLIGSESGQGRSGVLQKNGIPLLSLHDGVEWITELKGMGFGRRTDDKTVHKRIGHSIRIGRATLEQVEAELGSYAALSEGGLIENDLLTPMAIAGVILPEFATREDIFRPVNANITYDSALISAQTFRVVSSTRRLAYSGNPAFDLPYIRSDRLLETVQTYLGKTFAAIRLNPPKNSFELLNPHAQNFIYTPGSLTLRLTDYSDIDLISKAEKYLTLSFPTSKEYRVFETKGARDRFLGGIKSVLEPRGMWNERLEILFEFSSEELITTRLEDEVLFPLFIDANRPAEIQKELLPKLPPNIYDKISGPKFSLADELTDLEHAFRRLSDSQAVTQRIPSIKRNAKFTADRLKALAQNAAHSSPITRDPEHAEVFKILEKAAKIIDEMAATIAPVTRENSEVEKLNRS